MAVVKSNTSSIYFTNSSNSKTVIKRERLSFSNVDASLIIFSMVAALVDFLSDIALVTAYYLAGHTFWALSTVALAVIPAIIIQGFSIRWYILDESATCSKWISHFCLLGVFFRHVDVLRAGLEARRSRDVADFQLLFHHQSDICMLQLFESFMESAPQVVLQLYIMIQVHDWGPWTGISAAASMVSLAWAIAAYSRAMCQARPDKPKASFFGLVLQAVWRGGLLAARITALVLFAVCCQAWLFLLLGLHWLGMTVWVVLQKTDLCSTPLEECAYNCVVGVVYCFCFFNLREGRARGRMLAFYVVTVTQNLACLYLFLALEQHSHPFLATLGAGTVIGGTIIGLSALLLYYRFFHPSGPITLFGPQSAPLPVVSQSNQQVERNNQELSQNQEHCQVSVQKERNTESQAHILAQATQLPSDIEKTNSLRSFKHLWSVDRDGSLSSRSDDVPVHGGSPQPFEGCTDKRLLLSSRGSSRHAIASSVSTSAQLEQGNISSALNQQNLLSQANIVGPESSTPSILLHPVLSAQANPTKYPSLTARSVQSLQLNHSNQSVHSSNTSQSTTSTHSNNTASIPLQVPPTIARPVLTSETELQGKLGPAVTDSNDSKLSWNCTSMMEDTQNSEIAECPVVESDNGGGLNKRRGICSSVELDLDKLEVSQPRQLLMTSENTLLQEGNEDDSFARLCQKLVDEAEVKQLGSIETAQGNEVRLKGAVIREEKDEKRESDYIDSKQSAISSDGTPSEVLSAHDYENICAVNIAREAWGLRSWRGYSDIETWLHDDSVVRDRRRDTLASIGTTTTLTSASSERSTTSESPPMPHPQWESSDANAPPLPSRRPRPSYNRMDDYLDTLAYDLAEIERRECANRTGDASQENVFVAQPYVVDQHGMLYPMPASLDTILEELEESSVSASTGTGTESIATAPGWASSLVATIDEIRMGTTMCTAVEDSVAVSESDFEVGSYRSLQLDASVLHNFPSKESAMDTVSAPHRFSYSLPSLLQAPRSWSHLSPEEVLFLSKLKPQPESEIKSESKSSSPHISIKQETDRKDGRKPRRKFSLLREKFEKKVESKGTDKAVSMLATCSRSDQTVDGSVNEGNPEEEKNIASCRPNEALNSQDFKMCINSGTVEISKEHCSSINPFKEADLKPTVWSTSDEAITCRGRYFLKQVIAPPKLVPRAKKLALASNASA